MRFWKRRARGNVVKPFEPLIAAMRRKDPELWKIVGPMPVHRAWQEWIKTYPEDFPLRGMDIPSAEACIKPKRHLYVV